MIEVGHGLTVPRGWVPIWVGDDVHSFIQFGELSDREDVGWAVTRQKTPASFEWMMEMYEKQGGPVTTTSGFFQYYFWELNKADNIVNLIAEARS